MRKPCAAGSLPTALWVVPVGELGGVARHVLDIAAVGLPGWRLVVLCPEGPLAVRLRQGGNAVVAGQFGPAAGFRASLRTLRRNIATLRPSIVHSHLAYADIVAAAAKTGSGVRLATTEHGIAGDSAIYHGSVREALLMALVHRARFLRTDIAIAVSEATKRAIVRKWRPRRDITVIPNGVDVGEIRSRVEAYRRDSEAGPRVLSLSRLSHEKRLPELLRAFAALRRAFPDATLTIAGDGPERAYLESVAHDLGLGDSVSFPGFLDPDAAMGGADVVVQLSAWENCSYTLLDAVSAGLGVVATPVGGNPEILPGVCLVDADDPAAVAAAITAQSKHEGKSDFVWITREEMAARIVAAYQGSR